MRRLCVFLSAAVLSFAAGAAEETEYLNNKLTALQGTMQSINEELSDQRAKIGQLAAELENSNYDNAKTYSALLEEIKALRRQNQSLIDALFSGTQVEGSPDLNGGVKPLRNYDMQTPDGKLYWGEDEFVYVKEANAAFDARIDTGAAVSSISAEDITEFERQGKKWYRFTVNANGRTLVCEAPFVRYSDVRQSSKMDTTKRVVVSLNVKIGDYSTSSEFTLTDRSKMQYALLIGRTLIQDTAVVDVARTHIQGTPDSSMQVILMRDDYLELRKQGINPNAEYDLKSQSQAGQIAYPGSSNAAVSTNPDDALPSVMHQKRINEEEAEE